MRNICYIKNCLLFISFLFFVIFSSCDKSNDKNYTDSTFSPIIDSLIPENKSFSIICVGDIMMGSTYPAPLLPPSDGKYLFDDVSDILSDADITLGNLEGPLLDKGGTPKNCGESSEHCYSFKMPERYAVYLKNSGFDVLNLANNHAGDMGTEGRKATYNTLNAHDILFAGTVDYPICIFEKDGKKIGITGFAPNRGTLNLNDIETAEKIVRDLKSKTDFVIVSVHAGAEGAGAQHVTKSTEFYLGENRGNVYIFAHKLVDAGADFVFGHGPHVTRAVELYNNKFIAYSLGNFCTYGKFSLAGVQGIAPIIKVFIDDNGDFIKAFVTSVKQINRGIPVIDKSNSAYNTLKSLTRSDFYDTKLFFSEDNVIYIAD